MKQNICELRTKVKSGHPLVHCITNPISIHQCANAVLAIGGRPIMAEHPKEVAEITETADALLLNLGNITDARMESILISAKTAKEKGIPVILDAVGTACSSLRKSFAQTVFDTAMPTVIKGNYSEIHALYHDTYRSVGVDADTALDALSMEQTAVALSQKLGAVILASGKEDLITDGHRVIKVKNGIPMLSAVTGTGCMLGALCAAYLTAADGVSASVAACAVLGICGQLAESEKGTGTFLLQLMDALSCLSESELETMINLEVIQR